MCVAALAQAQVGPSISYRMSPAHSVALDTDIIATITLDGLHPTSYSSVIFRADLTRKTTIHTTPETRCNGDAPTRESVAWMDPDPSTLDMKVYGEWQEFRFRTNVTQ